MPSSGSLSPSRVIPISVTGRARHQSPASRRDMISFNKARAAASAPTTTTTTATKDKRAAQSESQISQRLPKRTTEEKPVKVIWLPPVEGQMSSDKSSASETKSKRVASPQVMSLATEKETESRKYVSDDEKERGTVDDGELEDTVRTASTMSPTEKKILDSVSVEDLIEKVIKPAGSDAKVSSSGESKVRYHVEKTEQEDGTTKTQIVLESKVEEELDFSQDSSLEELLKQGVKKLSLEDIKDTATGSMVKSLLSGLQGGEEKKSVNVEIIEEPVESYSDEELEAEERSTFHEPSAYFQVEEPESVPHSSQDQRSDNNGMKSSTHESKFGSVQVQEVSRESESPYFSQDQESHEYFVSTPDDNLSESEEGGGITSYGHYGIVDDLSDERYYQDEGLPLKKVTVKESDEYEFMAGDRLFAKESFPECIIEEEVRVSPVVQESVLEYLREDSLEPKEQLKGALEKLQSSVSGPLKEELAFLTKVSSENLENVAIDVKRVQQSSDNGTTTIVAELNVSQTLEDSGLLEGDDLSEDQIMAALKSSNIGFGKMFHSGAEGGYSITVSREDDVAHSAEYGDLGNIGGSASEIIEKHVKLGPSEKSFTLQMDVHDSRSEATSDQELQSQIVETPVKISHEKRIATLYLESPSDD